MNKIIKSISWKYLILIFLTILIFVLSLFFGSSGFIFNDYIDAETICNLRLPRVLCVALIGASLSICGVAMQGLLRNPLADGTTIGVSSGASLGAIIMIIIMSASSLINIAQLDFLVYVFAILGAFFSFALLVAVSYKIDKRLSSNTIILFGIVFCMFANAIISLLVSLFPQNAKSILFWTMGSVSGANYSDIIILSIAFVLGIIVLLFKSRELNAFSMGEQSALSVGVNIKSSKFLVVLCFMIWMMIGVCVSISGTIAFVGLIVPHIMRMIEGPNHKRLLGFSMLFGASFLMLSDLISRIILLPKELPIGVITSIIGVVVFVWIFIKSSKAKS